MKKYLNFFICEVEGIKYFADSIDTLCRLENEAEKAKLMDLPEGKVFYFPQ